MILDWTEIRKRNEYFKTFSTKLQGFKRNSFKSQLLVTQMSFVVPLFIQRSH